MSTQQQPAYVIYRASSLGTSLSQALTEMIALGELTTTHGRNCLEHFDRAIEENFYQNANLTENITLTGELAAYRHCDAVWSLLLSSAKFAKENGIVQGKNIKIVACEAKKTKKR